MPTLRRVVLARQAAARSDGELLSAFVGARDADAFAELVRRHGPMVLGVCRRVAGDRDAADDAFQAAFLVLARRAASVRPREQVGNWLYGVAYKTALKARVVLARRRSREKQVEVMPEPTATAAPPTADWAELQQVIDEELARLPDKLRLPVVLCDLEGRPQREVAKHLNVPAATLATRLASARRTLAQRLTRRGVALSGGALAGLLGAHGSASAVPFALSASVFRLGEAVATGAAMNSLVSAQAFQLSEGVMRMMMLAKLKAVAVTAATALALTTGLGLGLMPASAGDHPATGLSTALAARPTPAAPPGSIDKQLAARLADARPEPAADDATFLRRLCLDIRGTPPTEVESWFFVADQDDDKRAKVAEWLVEDGEAKVVVAKKLGVPVERVKVVRGRLSADGKFVELTVEDTPEFTDHYAGVEALEKRVVVVGQDKPGGATRRLRLAAEPKKEKEAQWLDVLVDPLDQKAGVDRLIELHYRLADPRGGDKQLLAGRPDDGKFEKRVLEYTVKLNDSDAEFLKRVLTDVRGGGPTALELKYFTEDRDPKKREKLLDTLLKDPAVQKKLGDTWKQKMLSLKVEPLRTEGRLFLFDNVEPKPRPEQPRRLVVPLPPQPPAPPATPKPPAKRIEIEVRPKPPVPPTPPVPPRPPAPRADRLDRLVAELIAAKKSDEAILEGLTLATFSRLPTDGEKKLALAAIGAAADRKAAWLSVARALAGDAKGAKEKDKEGKKGFTDLEIELHAKPKPAKP